MKDLKTLPTETLLEYIQHYQDNFWAYWAAMGTINWLKDADAALAEAKKAQKPVLLDFSAAPM